MSHRARQITGLFVLPLLLLAGIFVIAFTEHGAGLRAVTVNGRSMLPEIRSGDLVVVQRQTDYSVGDIVLYRSGPKSEVIHRIKRLEQGSFVLQGDNNPSEDSARPGPTDIIGRLLIRVPGGGRYLQFLQSPLIGTLALSGTLLGLISARSAHSRKRAEITMPGVPFALDRLPGQLIRVRPVQIMFVAALVLALAALALAQYSNSTLSTETVRSSSEVRHFGSFAYAASTSSNDPLLSSVTTGKPLYFKITDQFTVDYTYRYEAERPFAVQSSTALVARVRADDGWTAELTSTPQTAPTGDARSLRLPIDLNEAVDAIKRLESGTGVRFPLYYLDVMATTHLAGDAGGAQTSFDFAPELTFRIDANGLRLERSAQREGSVLEPRQSETVTETFTRPREVAVFGWRFAPSTSKSAPTVLSVLSAVAFGSAFIMAVVFSRMPLAARLSATGVGTFVPVNEAPYDDGRLAVQVDRLDQLLQLSDGEPILVYMDQDGEVFLAIARGYRYIWRSVHEITTEFTSQLQQESQGAA